MVLGITNRRLRTLCKNYFETGENPKENRGGDRKSQKNSLKKALVIAHIKSFEVIEEHHCRERSGKVSHRQYLKSDLSIRKMHKMFNKKNPEKPVNLQYYRRIFNSTFNLGFRIPASDVCSTCLFLKESIKKLNPKLDSENLPYSDDPESAPVADNPEKQRLIEEYREHKVEASNFFRLLKEKTEGLMIMSFDCQKNLMLPKLPDQSTYYSRQIHLYGFGIVVGSSKDPLTKNNVTMYHWTENKHFKGSSEIASAVYHKLRTTNFAGIKKLRLVCDGCVGQNKNSILLGMLQYWYLLEAPENLKEIQVVFPVTGHSYMPPDRVFAQIEKRIRKLETIVQPQEYIDIYREFASTVELGSENCPVFEFKTNLAQYLKTTSSWHFKISESKRVFIIKQKNSTVVRGESSYRCENNGFKTVIKRGKKLSLMNIDQKISGRKVKEAKIRDVEKLLGKHFGNDWRDDGSLEFYNNLILSNQTQIDDGQDDTLNVRCIDQ
jgi:hypothetical protein